MIGILIILAVSWILLHFLARKDLKALGYLPIRRRVSQFGQGLIFGLVLGALLFFAEATIRDVPWELSSHISISEILQTLYYHLKSALTEDLIFRGALLYLLMTKIKSWMGILISGVAFGIYHWFSFGILNGSAVVLTYVFMTTGLMGVVWALAFQKTKSMALGWGLHSGGNIAVACLLVAQPYGEVLITTSGGTQFSEGTESILAIVKGLFPPLITYLLIRFAYKKAETSC